MFFVCQSFSKASNNDVGKKFFLYFMQSNFLCFHTFSVSKTEFNATKVKEVKESGRKGKLPRPHLTSTVK
jgi:hypothetical protein